MSFGNTSLVSVKNNVILFVPAADTYPRQIISTTLIPLFSSLSCSRLRGVIVFLSNFR